MNLSVLQLITSFLFGHKYYANIVCMAGTEEYGAASFIFHTKEEARKHKQDLKHNRSFQYIETISFRSRNIYPVVKR